VDFVYAAFKMPDTPPHLHEQNALNAAVHTASVVAPDIRHAQQVLTRLMLFWPFFRYWAPPGCHTVFDLRQPGQPMLIVGFSIEWFAMAGAADCGWAPP